MVDITDYLANQTPSGVYVDKTGGGSGGTIVNGQKSLATSYTTFLTLLTAQLKNQDPTSPMDTDNFTQQLVSMTGVQQQLLSNELLQKMLTAQASSTGYDAVALIGKNVTALGSDSQLTGGQAKWSYSFPSAATSGALTISDASGKTVWSGAAPDLTTGRHDFVWDGKDSTGAQLPDGKYTLKISGKGAADQDLLGSTYFSGVVSSIEQVDGQTLLKIGPNKVGVSAIAEVTG